MNPLLITKTWKWPWKLIRWTIGKKVGIELKILFNHWRRFGIYDPHIMPDLLILPKTKLSRITRQEMKSKILRLFASKSSVLQKIYQQCAKIYCLHQDQKISPMRVQYIYDLYNIWLFGVVEDLSGLRDKGPGFKTWSRPLTFTKEATEFSEPYTLWGSHALTNSIEFRHAKRR
jgi:hypothetical protein